MTGKFTFISETEHATLDWGRVGALCDPSGTGARQLVVLDARLFPGNGHDFHKHVQQEEVILVVTGQIEQWIDTEKRVLGPGDSAFIAADTVHASSNIGKDEANIIAIFGPSVGDSGFEMVDMAGEAPWNSLRPTPTPKA